MRYEIDQTERLKQWMRDYVERSGDTHLKQGLDTGHDMRRAVQLSVGVRHFHGANIYYHLEMEPRPNPSAYALTLLETVARHCADVNEFELEHPIVWVRSEPLVQRVNVLGHKQTAVVASLRMAGMPDMYLAWGAEPVRSMEGRPSIAGSS